MDMYVIHDIYLESGNMSAQIDYMVFTRKRVYIIECKNLIGDITVDADGNFIRKYELFGRYIKEGIYSPITQNERHLEVVRQVRATAKGNFITKALFESNFDNVYKSLVVLANPKTVLNDRYAKKEVKQKIYRADQLVRVLKEMDAEVTDYSYSEKDMKQLAQFFLDVSVSNKSDYSKKYEDLLNQYDMSNKYNLDNVEQEKICPKCGNKLIKKVAKKGPNTGNYFWGCSGFPNCRYIENV